MAFIDATWNLPSNAAKKKKKAELRAANKDFYLLTPPPWVQVGLSINKHASVSRKGVRVFMTTVLTK